MPVTHPFQTIAAPPHYLAALRRCRPAEAAGAMDELLSILEGLAFITREPCELDVAIETSPVLETLLVLLEAECDWEGTASELLTILQEISRERRLNFEHHPQWPLSPSAAPVAPLAEIDPYLQQAGFTRVFRRLRQLSLPQIPPARLTSWHDCDERCRHRAERREYRSRG